MQHKELIPITSHLYFIDIESYWAGNTVKYHVRSPNPEEAWQSTFKRLYTYRWLWPPFLEQQLMLKRTAASRTRFFLVFVFVMKLRPLKVPGESQLHEAGTNAFTFRTMWTILEARSGHGLRPQGSGFGCVAAQKPQKWWQHKRPWWQHILLMHPLFMLHTFCSYFPWIFTDL